MSERLLRAGGLGRSLVWLLVLVIIGTIIFKQFGSNHPLPIILFLLTVLYAAGIIATSVIAIFEPNVRSHWRRF